MKKTTVYLPDELKVRLERTARERGISEAEAIRIAIDAFTETGARRPTLPLFTGPLRRPIAEHVEELLAEGFGKD